MRDMRSVSVCRPPPAPGSSLPAHARDAEVDEGAGAAVDLGEFLSGAGEADFESFDLSEPAFAFGFGDAGVAGVAGFGLVEHRLDHRGRAGGE